MTPSDLELIIEALSMAASRKESMARSNPSYSHHERRALAMRSLRRRLQSATPQPTRAATTAIERTLVGWFEARGFEVQHDGHEWNAWAGGRMFPLTEIAVAIAIELPAGAPA